MKAFFKEKKRSAGYARDRMKLLLISERIDCSPQMMKMLRNDMIHTVKKYLTIDEEQVKIQITQEPAVLHAYIPVLNKKDNRLVSSQLLKRTDKLCPELSMGKVRRLFSLYAAISATINPTAAEITLSVAKRIAGNVMAARHA